MGRWQQYSDKFLSITLREQYLILFAGLAVIFFSLFNLFIDANLTQSHKLRGQISSAQSSINSSSQTIAVLEQSLLVDPNDSVNKQIAQYEQKMSEVDQELLLLTSDLINPIQMRTALMDLLNAQKSITLLSFDTIAAQPLNLAQPDADKADNQTAEQMPEQALKLYKHGIKIKLKGSYFALRDYLAQVEQLDWKFFWQNFDYQLTEYPKSQLVIEMYSLSTKQEFIGV